jgi:hypothetical protein
VHHETPNDGCYICQPDNPNADAEGCSDCDRKAHMPVAHTRTQTDRGPDFCLECSEAIGEYVTWPCEARSANPLVDGLLADAQGVADGSQRLATVVQDSGLVSPGEVDLAGESAKVSEGVKADAVGETEESDAALGGLSLRSGGLDHASTVVDAGERSQPPLIIPKTLDRTAPDALVEALELANCSRCGVAALLHGDYGCSLTDAEALAPTVAQLIDAAVAQRTAHLVIEGERLREVVGRVEALADEWADFEHDAVACQRYVCGDCTMLNAIYDLRAALHPGEAR